MQPQFSETLSAMFACINRLDNSPEVTAQMRVELQSMRALSTEIAIYYQESVSEVSNLSHQLAQLSHERTNHNSQTNLQHNLQKEDEIYTLLALIFARLKQSIDIEELLDTVAFEIYQLLQVDQVIVYPLENQNQLQNPPSNAIVSEDPLADEQNLLVKHEVVKTSTRSLLNQPIPSLYISSEWIETCHQNISYVIDDIHNAEPQASAILQPMGIGAAIAVAIPNGKETWGLILVHQYDHSRTWQAWEIDLLEKLATQLAIFIHQMLG